MPSEFRLIDPRELRLPTYRVNGADPEKLHRQIARFGASMDNMLPPIVYESSDGVLVLYDGVTRSERIARLSPGTLIRVEVIGRLRKGYLHAKKIGDLLHGH
jgi:hypothetical protein